MLVTNCQGKLYEQLQPAISTAKSVVIAAAYVTPGACQLLQLLNRSAKISVKLSIGRALQEGLSEPSRRYLLQLDRLARAQGGGVRVDPNGFHSKLYATDILASIGSSNLTEHGLSDWTEANLVVQGEAANMVRAEAERLFNGGVPFEDVIDEIPNLVIIKRTVGAGDSKVEMPAEPGHPTPGVEISLLDRYGEVPARSGLNWGLGEGRERDRYECYIRFPTSVHELGEYVFGSKDKGTTFLVNTHDGHRFRLRLQGNSRQGESAAKQISTSGDNSALGRWMIENCLGIKDGRAVTKDDLDSYGRTTVEFYRTGTASDGSAIVYLDFSRR